MMSLPRWTLVALWIISLIFTLTGIGMVVSGAEGGWPALLFFGLCTAVFTAQLWPKVLLAEPLASPESLLQRFPGPVDLRVPQRKTALLLVGLIVFAAVCLWYLYKDPPQPMIAAFLWLCVALLACALPFMLYQLVKGSGLRLEADGFRMTQPWRKRFTRWDDTSDFDIRNFSLIPTYGGGWSTLVIFDDKGARQSKLASLNVSLVGRNSALPDSYGMTPDELRNLMNGWRKLALAR